MERRLGKVLTALGESSTGTGPRPLAAFARSAEIPRSVNAQHSCLSQQHVAGHGGQLPPCEVGVDEQHQDHQKAQRPWIEREQPAGRTGHGDPVQAGVRVDSGRRHIQLVSTWPRCPTHHSRCLGLGASALMALGVDAAARDAVFTEQDQAAQLAADQDHYAVKVAQRLA